MHDKSELTALEIKEYCRGKIAHYTIPGQVRFVNEFPMTVTGKIRKIEMREAMIAELRLQNSKKGFKMYCSSPFNEQENKLQPCYNFIFSTKSFRFQL
jgi:hypothetical protein